MDNHDNLFVFRNSEEDEAVARLADNPADYKLVLSQAHFIENHVVLEHFRFDKKPKRFEMTATEMDTLVQAWTVFQAEKKTRKEQKEAAFADIERQASAAMEDHTVFTYKSLNMVIQSQDDFFFLRIPALSLSKWRVPAEGVIEAIAQLKQNLREQVEDAEKLGWEKSDWPQIIASYRAVFPAEPTEIQQLRDLLKNNLPLTGWSICAVYPGALNDSWSFDNGLSGEEHFALLNKPASELLNCISAYVINSSREEADNLDISDQIIQNVYPPVSDEMEHEIYP